MKLIVDARYTRIGFPDQHQPLHCLLLGALKTLIDTGDEAAADLDLTMIISDERRWTCCVKDLLAHRPAPNRLAAAEQSAGRGVLPMQTIGSTGRKFKLILTLRPDLLL